MTSPSPDPSPLLPASLGWLSAHAMETDAAAAWWLNPLTEARAAAEGMQRLPDEGMQGTGALGDFAEPFRVAQEHMDLIREPAKAVGKSASSSIGGIGGVGDVATAGPAGLGIGAIGSPGASDGKNGKAVPAGIGSALDAAGIGELFRNTGVTPSQESAKRNAHPARPARIADGSWVETGNPTTRSSRASASTRGTGNPGPAPISASRPTARDGIPARGFHGRIGGKPVSPPPSPFAGWAENVNRKIAGYGPKPDPQNPHSINDLDAKGGTASPTRAPSIVPLDDVAFARFLELLKQRAPNPHGPGASSTPKVPAVAISGTPSAGSTAPGATRPSDRSPSYSTYSSNDLSPVQHPFSRPPGSPEPSAPDLADLVDNLYGPVRSDPAGHPAENNTYSPVQHPFSQRPAGGDLSPVATKGKAGPGAGPSAVAPAAANAPAEAASQVRQGTSEMEWMDEEDDLAAKLHRLLRRQAKRRGVDLT